MIVASLCTIPNRLDSLIQVLVSLLNQTRKPDLVLISISEFYPRSGKYYPKRDREKLTVFLENYPLPSQLMMSELDIGPCKKLLTPLSHPILKSSDFIVTIDDDSPLRPDAIEKLLKSHLKNPGGVYSVMGVREGSYIHAEYIPDNFDYFVIDIVGGYRGVLYPAHLVDYDSFFNFVSPLMEAHKEQNLLLMHDDHVISYYFKQKYVERRVAGGMKSETSAINYITIPNENGIVTDPRSVESMSIIKSFLDSALISRSY